ncbi:MAG TPA: hypothetical protein VGU20_23120 [Stellaceae bacterium]|nr:hypothetical protein [Stellaceae bacterium]
MDFPLRRAFQQAQPLGIQFNIRLFTTLVRFDTVYHGHFKCNLRRIADYPALWRFTRDIYNLPNIAATVNLTTSGGITTRATRPSIRRG